MYAVVGCTECGSYWLLDDPETQVSATCLTCGRRHQTKKLRRFYTAESRAAAVEARAALLAQKRDQTEQFEAVPDAGQLQRQVAEGTRIDDDEYLDQSGVDPEEAAEAGDVSRERSPSRDEIVRNAVRESSDGGGTADRETILDYATDRGVPRDAAADLLDRLRRRGEATETNGEYRLL